MREHSGKRWTVLLPYSHLLTTHPLKEAQEKTDEITAKFLDKEKDPLNYRPQPIVTASSESASAAAANASASLKREQANKALKKKSAATSKSGGRVKSSQQHQQVGLFDL